MLYDHTSAFVSRGGLSGEKFETLIGIRQGAPTSPFLFDCYIDPVVEKLAAFGMDDYLQDLHCLLHADDTCVVASSKQALMRKIQIVQNFCQEVELKINIQKSQMMCFNGSREDCQPLQVDGHVYSFAQEFWYVCAPFSSARSIQEPLRVFV